MKKLFFCVLLLLFSLEANLFALDCFIGLEPMITQEKSYAAGEYDVNVVPLIVSCQISQKFDLRLLNITNEHHGAVGGKSARGYEAALPYYFNSKRKGFYFAPVYSASNNSLFSRKEETTSMELGYAFLSKNGFSLNLGAQSGTTIMIPTRGSKTSVSHFGVRVFFGYWL